MTRDRPCGAASPLHTPSASTSHGHTRPQSCLSAAWLRGIRIAPPLVLARPGWALPNQLGPPARLHSALLGPVRLTRLRSTCSVHKVGSAGPRWAHCVHKLGSAWPCLASFCLLGPMRPTCLASFSQEDTVFSHLCPIWPQGHVLGTAGLTCSLSLSSVTCEARPPTTVHLRTPLLLGILGELFILGGLDILHIDLSRF